MRRAPLILVILCAVLAGAVLLLTASGDARTQPRSLATNRAAARADAAALLADGAAALPAGAQRVGSEPAGDHGYLGGGPLLGTPAGVVDKGWWELSGTTPDQVIAAVRASPPPGVSSIETDSAGNVKTGTTATGLVFDLVPVPGVLANRMLDVAATALRNGVTGVVIQSQSVWFVPRTAASVVPVRTRVITVAAATAAGKVVESKTVTAGSRVRAVVAFFNGLAPVQPGSINCPAELSGADVITVRFLPSRAGTPLATATFSEVLGASSLSACNPVDLKVNGTSEDALIGGNYVRALDRLLAVRLPVRAGGTGP